MQADIRVQLPLVVDEAEVLHPEPLCLEHSQQKTQGKHAMGIEFKALVSADRHGEVKQAARLQHSSEDIETLLVSAIVDRVAVAPQTEMLKRV